MEHTMVHLAEAAAWVFVIVFAFAIIGVYATIRWIVNLVTSAERAVENDVRSAEDRITHRNP
jgi:MinD-like ATPase involved in chromosome partitioning or flagellar assembly